MAIDRRIQFAPGERVQGKYLVDRPIGGGSESQLYLCLNTQGERYTLKVVHGKTQEVAQESSNLQGLQHPSIPKLIETWADGGTAFLVRQFIEGMALDRYIEEHGPFNAPATAALLLAILDAVEYLHDRTPPLIHRDLKPHNVMLSAQGVHLIDFGLSSSAGVVTGPEGSLGYSAPEQLRRGVSEVACDLYSLGAIGVYAWTGRPPTLNAAVKAIPPDSKLESRGRNQPLWDLLLQCLESNPQDRPASASDMMVALQFWLAKNGLKSDFSVDPKRLSGSDRSPTSGPMVVRPAQLRLKMLLYAVGWLALLYGVLRVVPFHRP